MFFLFFIVESIKNLLKCKSLVQICIFLNERQAGGDKNLLHTDGASLYS